MSITFTREESLKLFTEAPRIDEHYGSEILKNIGKKSPKEIITLILEENLNGDKNKTSK